jgi:hypothetical protein
MKDPQVLELGAAPGRVIVTHDVRTCAAGSGTSYKIGSVQG